MNKCEGQTKVYLGILFHFDLVYLISNWVLNVFLIFSYSHDLFQGFCQLWWWFEKYFLLIVCNWHFNIHRMATYSFHLQISPQTEILKLLTKLPLRSKEYVGKVDVFIFSLWPNKNRNMFFFNRFVKWFRTTISGKFHYIFFETLPISPLKFAHIYIQLYEW